MPVEQDFRSSFVVPADQEHIVRQNKQRIENQFRVRLDFPADGSSTHKERWINISAAASQEVCSKVTEFVKALYRPETRSAHQCALSVYRQLLFSDLRELLECEYGVVIETVDDQRCTILVLGSELSVALALSAIDEGTLSGAPATAAAAGAGWHDLPSHGSQPPSTDPPLLAPRSQANVQLQGLEMDGLAAVLNQLNPRSQVVAETDDGADMIILPRSLPKARARPGSIRSVNRDVPDRASDVGRTRVSVLSTERPESDSSCSNSQVPPPSELVNEIDNTHELIEAASRAGYDDMEIAVLLSQTAGHPHSGCYRSSAEFISALEEARQQKNDLRLAVGGPQNADDRARLLTAMQAAAQPTARTTHTLAEAARLLPTGLAAAASVAAASRATPPLGRPLDLGSGGLQGAADGSRAAATADLVPVMLSSSGIRRPGEGSLEARMTPVSSPSSRDRAQTGAGTFPPTRSPNAAPPFFLGHESAGADWYGAIGRTQPPLPGSGTQGLLGPRPQSLLGPMPLLPPQGQQGLYSTAAAAAAASPWRLDLRAFPDAAPKPAAAVTGPLGGNRASSALRHERPPTMSQATTVLPEYKSNPAVLAFTSNSKDNMDPAAFARMQGYSDAAIAAASRALGDNASFADFMRALKTGRAPDTAAEQYKSNPAVLAFTSNTKDNMDPAAFARMQGYSEAAIAAASRALGDNANYADFMKAVKTGRAPDTAAEQVPSRQGAAAAATTSTASRPFEQQQQKPGQTGAATVAPLRGNHPALRKDLSAVGQWQGSSEKSSYSDQQASSGLDSQQQKPRGSAPVALVLPTSTGKIRGSEPAQPPNAAAVRQGKSTSVSSSSPSSKKSLDMYDFAKMQGFTDDDISAALAELGKDATLQQLMATLKRQRLQSEAGDAAVKFANQPAASSTISAANDRGSGQQRQSGAARLSTAVVASDPSASRASQPGSRRHVVIDGSNVAMHQSDGIFRCWNIQICVNYFLARGHKEITVVVPMHRKTDAATRDAHILEELHSKRMLVYQPSKKLPNMSPIRPYDDKLILDIAIQYDGVVISNDNYKDLLDSSPDRDRIIKTRVIMFTIIGDNMFYINEDPMGKHGPSLEQLLTRS